MSPQIHCCRENKLIRRIINGYKKWREQINYVIVGGLTTIISLGTYYLCVFTILDTDDFVQFQLANSISWICCVTFAYFANRKYVFDSNEKNILAEIIKFYGSRLTTLVADISCMTLMVTILGINDKVAKLFVQVIVFVLNYVLSKFLVFRKD